MFEVRNRDLGYVGAFARVTEASVVLRSNRDDSWSVTVPALSAFQRAVNDQTLDDIISFGGGIRITDDTTGEVYITGRLNRRQFHWKLGAGEIVYSGKGDSEILTWRLARPAPLQPINNQNVAYGVYTGTAETIMRQIVDLNLGPGALAYRRVPFYRNSPSLGAGAQVTADVRFDRLDEVLFDIAYRGGDLLYRVIQPGETPALELQVGAPRDLRDAVVFEPGNNNVSEYTQETSAPEMTAATVAGQGELTARQLQEIDGYNEKWDRRIEGFVERSDTPDLSLQLRTAREKLREAAGVSAITFNTLDTPTLKYGVDYRLNDIVGVRIGTELGGVAQLVDAVRQVKLTWAKGKYWTAEPTVGPVDSEDFRKPRIYRRVSRLEAKREGGRIR